MPNDSSVYKSLEGQAAMTAWYEAALKRLPLPHESLVIPTRHGDTHVIAVGPAGAAPLVLLHGLSANAMVWQRPLPRLAKDFRVYVPDIIGMTGKSAPTRLPYNSPGYAEWLREVLLALKAQPAGLVGIGFSAWLICKLAALSPNLISKAVLISPAGLLPIRWRFLVPKIWDVLFISDEQARRLSRNMLAPLDGPVDEDAAEMVYLILKHCTNQFEASALLDSELKLLTAPTLVLVGQHEFYWDPLSLIARARQTLPGLVAAEIVPNAGSGLTASQPEVVSTRILRFMKDTV